jgi:hypothetical protein
MTTKLHIVCDTHIQPKTTDEEARVVKSLTQLIHDMNTKASYTDLILPHMGDGTKLLGVRMLSWAVESGTKYARLHFHCVLQITHTGRFLLTASDGINSTERFREWIVDRLPWLKPNSVYYRETTTPYVRVHLGDSTAENYATKDRDDDGD